MNYLSLRGIVRGLAVLSVIGAATAFPRLSMATAIVTAPTIALVEPAVHGVITGSFNVIVSDTVPTDVLSGFQVDLWLPTVLGTSSESNVLFTGADYSTMAAGTFNPAAYPYAFANSTSQQNDTVFYGDINGPNNAAANDAYNTDGPLNNVGVAFTTIYALVHVDYSVAANFIGSVPLTLVAEGGADPYGTFVYLNGNTSTDVIPTIVNGSISVVQSPEPTSVVLMVLGAVGLFGFRRLRARRA